MIDDRSFTYDARYYEQGIGGFHAASFAKITDKFRNAVRDRSLGSVLDLGCGNGFYGPFLRTVADRVEGVDRSSAVEHDNKFHEAYHQLLRADLGVSWTAPRSYDAVFSVEVIEHVKDYDVFLRNAHDALRPGGLFFLTTTTYFWTLFVLLIIYRRQVSAESLIEFSRGLSGNKQARSRFVMRFWDYFTGHYHGFTRSQLACALRQAGFEIERIDNLHVQPVFPVRYLDQPYHGAWAPLVRLGMPILKASGNTINIACKSFDLYAPNVVVVARKRK